MNQAIPAHDHRAVVEAQSSPPAHDPIFYVTVRFSEEVHANGFTSRLDKYVCAADADEARRVGIAYFENKGCKVTTAEARLSGIQDTNRLNADNIVNIPREVLFAQYERRQTPLRYRIEPVYIDPRRKAH
ncbi:hypothetical protein [Burkholderia sp. Ac-20365]|uniref:hypothetical protein n=1 Tax=Burkholderia sp. Ac-20365 TaxID=2703897 RepID=UPI00197CAA9D|nr:hypothetical protein [Burkholderia sp. Ac-20365]MBN3760938.1 hypothetical protein [Burkholderia sp. Ac-20365]